MFNSLKTAERAFSTRGTKLSFDEVVTLLKSEDDQLLQESGSNLDKSTVLVTTHSNLTDQQSTASGSGNSSVVSSVPSQGSNMNHMQYSYNQPMNFGQPVPSFNNFYPQVQQYSGNFKNSRGSGGKGSRHPRDPCAICGRTNHITAYCYYNNSAVQWRGNVMNPSFYPNSGIQMSQQAPRQFGGFTAGPSHTSIQMPQTRFAGYPGGTDMTVPSGFGSSVPSFGQYDMSHLSSSSSSLGLYEVPNFPTGVPSFSHQIT